MYLTSEEVSALVKSEATTKTVKISNFFTATLMVIVGFRLNTDLGYNELVFYSSRRRALESGVLHLHTDVTHF